MKTIKVFDAWILVALCLFALLYSLAQSAPGEITLVPLGSYMLGAWQLLSIILHLIFNRYYRALKQRSYYLRVFLIVAILGIPFFNASFHVQFLLLFIPLLAIWYIGICFAEIRLLEYKAFIHLK